MNFKYFKEPLKYADFSDKACEVCGSNQNCLDTIYFGYSSEDIESVCIKCLQDGKALVDIPDFIYERISSEVKNKFQHESKEAAEERIALIINSLAKNPPIPWVQNNDWQVCCGDFMTYLGELEREDLDSIANDGDGKALLLNLIDEEAKNRIDDLECLWDELGDCSVAYYFKCMECGKEKIVIQSF